MSGAPRRRTIQWDAPAPADAGMSGLEMLRALADGRRPRPGAGALIGLGLGTVEPGRVQVRFTPDECLYNPVGSVHGGVIATALDTAMACAVTSTLPAGRACTTVEIKVNYIRAVTAAAGPMTGEGVCVHAGRRTGVAEGRLLDANGRLYATANTTLFVFDAPPDAAPVQPGPTERVVEWDDPRAALRSGRDMAGVDYLRAVATGEAPRAPIAALLGFELVSVEPGAVSFRLPYGPHLANPAGAMHGGMMATLMDSALGCAVHSTLPAGRGYTTLEIKVNYARAVAEASGAITAAARVVHAGRQAAIAEAHATDAAGRLCATASTTCLLFDPPPGKGD